MMAGLRPVDPKYGTPIKLAPPGSRTANIRSVALGFTTGAEAPQLPPGMSSRGSNFLDVDGGLQMRPGLRLFDQSSDTGSVHSTLSSGGGAKVLWIGEASTSTGVRHPVILSGKFPLVYASGSWSSLSQVGPAGLSANTLHSWASDSRHFDAVPYYHPVSDEFELCFVNSAASGAFTWRPGTAVFSALSNSPAAGLVCAFDSRLVFSRVSSNGSLYPQRVQWSARGDPELYTTPDGGFEELLDAKGVITRLVNADDRVIVFFDREVWQGLKIAFPFTFQFVPITRAVGCPAPRSVVQTPKGIVFLGSDLNLYLLPPGGAPVAIGKDVRRLLLDDLSFVEWSTPETVRVYGIYDETRNGYLLLYDARTSGTQHGLFVSIDSGTASPLNVNTGGTPWQIRALGDTRLADSIVTTIQRQRVLIGADGSRRFAAEWSSEVSNEITYGPGPLFSLLTTTAVLAERAVLLPNPDPTERLYVRQARLDYRAGSASSASMFFSPDFGQSHPTVHALALPTNPISAQTVVPGGVSAVYPSIKVAVSGFTNVVMQGLTATVEGMGRG